MKILIWLYLAIGLPAQAQFISVGGNGQPGYVSSTVATPSFSPVAGAYSSPQTVTIATTTPSAVLCYTTDGTTPTETANLCLGGTTQTYSSPITVSTTQTVKALGTLSGYIDSLVASATYTIGFSHIESCNNQGGSSLTSITCTFGSPLTAGDFLYCSLNSSNSSLSYTMSGDSGTFTADLINYLWYYNLSSYYVPSLGGGGTTITASASGLSYTAIACDEFTSLGVLDKSDTGATGTGTTATSNSISTTANGDLLIGIISGDYTSGSVTPGAGWTVGAASTWPALNEYQIQSTSGSATATGTMMSSSHWAAHIVAFKQ